jgi:acyl-CoA synthetase (AMP-forming)/AMP-acid ligase II
MLLYDLLTQAAVRRPDKPAAVFSEDTVTFAQLDRMSLALAQHLARMGIGPSSRVAILHESSFAAIVSFWAVLRSGATTVDIAPVAGLAAREALAEARPAAVIIQSQLLRRMMTDDLAWCPPIVISGDEAADLAAPLGVAGRLFLVLNTMWEVPATAVALPRSDPASVAMCIYTSGTTGRPKGVMLSHNNLLWNLTCFNERLGLTSDDRLLLVAPLHYIHGRIQLLTFTMLAATTVLSGGFRFAQAVLQDLGRHRITTLSGVPYHFATLLNHSRLRQTPLPDLRHLIITGGALGPSALRALQEAVPNAALHVNYGLTEASPRLTYHGPSHEVLSRPASSGRPLPDVTIEILGNNDEPLPAGTIGELVASGPGIMVGYVSGDERTSGRIDRLGRLRTGDLGYFDTDGYLYLAGRSSEMIKTAGERLFPGEIEQVLQTYPGVAEAAVLGLPDPLLGERVVACIVTTPGHRPGVAEIKQHCLKALPYLRVPKDIHFVVDLPKTGSGKIQREALRARLVRPSGDVVDEAVA